MRSRVLVGLETQKRFYGPFLSHGGPIAHATEWCLPPSTADEEQQSIAAEALLISRMEELPDQWFWTIVAAILAGEVDMNVALRASIAIIAIATSFGPVLAAPAVAVAPNNGPPTTNISVSGSGFGANAAVDIYFDESDLCLALANAAGAISCILKVPASAQPQQHWISAVQRSTGTGAQKAFVVRTNLAQFHGRNAAHSGVNPFENTISVSNVGSLDLLWTQPVGASGADGSPIVFQGNVYAAGENGKLYAFNATTGASVAGFPVSVGATIGTTPVAGGGRVFVGAFDHKLYAFNASTGIPASGFPVTLGDLIESSPSLALGNVYVGCDDNKLYAFNATTGAPVSGFPILTGNIILGSPTVFNGVVYDGSDDNNLYAFNALTGATISGFPIATGSHVRDTLAVASGMGFFGSLDFKIYGFNLATGVALSGFPSATLGQIFGSPAIAGGRVFVGAADHKLYSNLTAGGASWSTVLDDIVYGSPMVANGVLYVNTGLRLYALNAATGFILWNAAMQKTGFGSPVVANGILYFASNDGNLYAFSVNGLPPTSRLLGGEFGVKPALSALTPDFALKPTAGAAAPMAPEDE